MKITFTKEEKQKMLENIKIDTNALCNCVKCEAIRCAICPINAMSTLSIYDAAEFIKNLHEEE